MKRVFAILFVTLFIFLTACSNGLFNSPPERERQFTSDITIKYKDKVFSGSLECNSHTDTRFTFTYPENLSGFEIRTSETGYICNVLGIENEISDGILQNTSCAELLFSGIEEVLYSQCELSINADGDYFSYFDNNKYKAVFSDEGYLTSLTAQSFDFEVSFEITAPQSFVS